MAHWGSMEHMAMGDMGLPHAMGAALHMGEHRYTGRRTHNEPHASHATARASVMV